MNMKRILTGTLATTMVLSTAAMSASAAGKSFTAVPTGAVGTSVAVYDADGEALSKPKAAGSITAAGLSIDPLQPGQTVYVELDLDNTAAWTVSPAADWNAAAGKTMFVDEDLDETKLYSVSLKKDKGSKLISKITVESEKDLDGSGTRKTYLKIVVNDTTAVDENKFEGKLEIKMKKDPTASNSNYATGTFGVAGDKVTIPLSFWVTNDVQKGEDIDPETGDKIVFDPANNEKNTIIWGEDRAALFFEANDDASKFYAKLSTKSNTAVYAKYGDPQDADLWFYDWTGGGTIPATSRATLTLGIPWDEDASYVPNVEDCHVYLLNADGTLTEVKNFVYDDENEGTTGIEGWSIKTRELGTYVLADKELELDVDDDDDDSSTATGSTTAPSAPTTSNGASIPNTGSSDVVNVAVVAAIVSLAAAGAVAFRKVK